MLTASQSVTRIMQGHNLIRHALDQRESIYDTDTVKWKLSYLYFFTVTPKGKNKKHKDYVSTLKRDLLALKPYNYGLWIKEYENTPHLHGIVSLKSNNYKFKKMFSDKYVFLASPLVDKDASIAYMNKHTPKKLYILYQRKVGLQIHYDIHQRPTYDRIHLKNKITYIKTKLNA